MKHIFTVILILSITFFSSNNTNAQCFDEGHSPFQEQGWLSCNTSVGPIPERGDAHWILYDFGYVYTLDSVYFWNHNVWGETGMGVKSILVDYSTDKENWTTIGPINVEKAPGSWKYTGTNGPSLGNVDARYALVTILSTWREDSPCAGLAEIRFGVNNTVAVTEIDVSLEWEISPNPATDFITIQIPNMNEIRSLTVYNAVGQKMQETIDPTGNELIMPISELKDGIYFISIVAASEIYTKSFVKG